MKSLGAKIALGIVGFIVLMFVLQFAGIEWFRYFETRKEDARREVFEETKSYVHASIQALAKYKREWDKGDQADRQSIEVLIQSEFAAFDADDIKVDKLRQFLIKVRGY